MKYNWFGSSSTSGYPHDQSRPGRPEEVTVVRFEVPQGVPVASTPGLQSGSSSPGTWGLRIADKDMEGVIRQLYPSRSLWIEGRIVSLFYLSVAMVKYFSVFFVFRTKHGRAGTAQTTEQPGKGCSVAVEVR